MEHSQRHETLRAALVRALPPELHDRIPAILPALEAVADGALSPAEASARLAGDPDLAAAVARLAGSQLDLGQALLSFGAGNQFGDVAIGPVAGRDLIQIELHVGQGGPPARAVLPRDRAREVMLERVRARWVDGLLAQTLAAGPQIALTLCSDPEAIAQPQERQYQELRQAQRAIPAGTPIQTILAESGGALLILGDPGSGKTTLLLQLCAALLDAAAADAQQPIPVIFNLSSWTSRTLTLTEWMRGELVKNYSVPRGVAEGWLRGEALLPLIDGLDEAPPQLGRACIRAINGFRQEQGLTPVVVCARRAEYAAILGGIAGGDAAEARDPAAREQLRLNLGGAVRIEPLTTAQVAAALARGGAPYAALAAAAAAPPLADLITTPLMLAILAATHGGPAGPAPATVAGGPQLWPAYIDAMFRRRERAGAYPRETTLRWLGYLARSAGPQAQSELFIEHLVQPDLLPSPAARWAYVLLDRVGGPLLVALLFAAYSLIFPVLGASLFGGLGLPVAAGLLAALFGGAPGREQRGARRWLPLFGRMALGWLLVGAGAGAAVGGAAGWRAGLAAGVVLGCAGLAAAALSGGLGSLARRVHIVELIAWSWRRALRPTAAGAAGGFALGALYMALVAPASTWAERGVAGLLLGLAAALVAALVAGVRRDVLELRQTPNQGIRRSLRVALLAGLAAGAAVGAVAAAVYGGVGGPAVGLRPAGAGGLWASAPQCAAANAGLVALLSGGSVCGPAYGLAYGLSYGLLAALVAGLAYGGQAARSHYALRIVLWRSGVLPLDLEGFFEHAVDRVLLHRVGGGYLFAHRPLRDYLATLGAPADAPPPPPQARARAARPPAGDGPTTGRAQNA